MSAGAEDSSSWRVAGGTARADVQTAGAIINAHPLSAYQVRILALCFLVAMVDGFDVAVIGYIAPALREAWSLQPAQLAPVFGAGLLGLMAGSFIVGPVADAYGRKRILLVAMLWFGLGTIACAHATSLEQLTWLRFVTGIGLGAAMPTCITLCSEYSPDRRRMLLVTLSWTGFTLGLALGGLAAGRIMALHGWQGVLWAGGVAPLVLLPFLAIWLPESVRYLASRPEHAHRLHQVLASMTGKDWRGVTMVADEATPRVLPVVLLFRDGYAARTLLLWVTFFCSLFVVYLLTNWLPSILRDAGYGVAVASDLGALLPIGGTLGAVLLALLMDRFSVYRILGWALLGAALAMAGTGYALHTYSLLLPVVFLAGFGLMGAQNGLNLLGATIYPTAARVTGISWGMALGRLGSIVGSMLGASMMAVAGGPELFFVLVAVPLVLGSLAVFLLARAVSPVHGGR